MSVKFVSYHSRPSHILMHAFLQEEVDFQCDVLNSVTEYGAWIKRVGHSEFL